VTTGPERSAPTTLADVLITSELSRRPARPPNHAQENLAVLDLAQGLDQNPDILLNRLLELALECCTADSAGVSLLEGASDRTQVFRWVALAGPMASFAGGTTPRHFSPSGVCLDRRSPQLFRQPARYFTYLDTTTSPEMFEVIVVELQHNDEQFGTVWIAAHDATRLFDREDARVLVNLAGIASTAFRLQTLRRQAEAANAAKDEFLLTLSHELRQPLTAILGWTRMLRRNTLAAPALAGAYEAIEKNAHAQVQLLTDLTDLSQIATGRLRVDLHPLDICPLVESVVAHLAPIGMGKQVVVKCELHHPVRVVHADEHRIRQIISNLILNAVKFTPAEGQVTVTVRENTDCVDIAVADTGIGIEPEFLSKMFEAFQQSSNRIEGRERGVGIGLTVVRELVKSCGGSVSAFSEGIGKGTTVVVRLPVPAST
jgi:signal transduction histidine kinase